MTIRTHTLGFPRVGLRRELKKRKKATGRVTPPAKNCWRWDASCARVTGISKTGGRRPAAGGRFRPVRPCSDHQPAAWQRAGSSSEQRWIGGYRYPVPHRPWPRANGEPAAAAEMTKWFNTNYHYMVPEFVKGQQFKLTGPSFWMKWTKRWRWVTSETRAAGAGHLPVAGQSER